jgi:hypothetical protein
MRERPVGRLKLGALDRQETTTPPARGPPPSGLQPGVGDGRGALLAAKEARREQGEGVVVDLARTPGKQHGAAIHGDRLKLPRVLGLGAR